MKHGNGWIIIWGQCGSSITLANHERLHAWVDKRINYSRDRKGRGLSKSLVPCFNKIARRAIRAASAGVMRNSGAGFVAPN